MKGSWPRARRAFDAAARALGETLRAPLLLAAALLPVAAAKLLPDAAAVSGLAAALARAAPAVCASAALAAFALLFRRRLGWRPGRAGDEETMVFCYVLVALLLGSAAGGFASARFEALVLAHIRTDIARWSRVRDLFSGALQLAGLAGTVVLALGLPTVPKHPELFGALWQGLRALARRPAAAAAWIAAAAAGDWLLAQGGGRLATAAAGGRLGEPTLVLVAWARQALAYALLVGAPLAAAEAP